MDERRRQRELHAAEVLLGVVAHDFTDVLQGVTTALDLATAALPERGPRSSRYLDDAGRFVLRGARLAHQLLVWISQAKGRLEPVALERVVQGVLLPLEGSLPPGVSLTFQNSTDSAVVPGDEDELEHLVQILVDNALESLDGPGQVWVALRGRARAEHELGQNEEHFFELSFRDDGLGMSKEVRARCLEPFFTTRTTRDAVGLGLPIALGIVRRHGGRLTIESTPRRGTCVTAIFPAGPR